MDKEKLKVLIVEDSPTIMVRIRQMLQELGGFFVVGAARNREEAITIIQIMLPKVVLLDTDLSGTTGTDLLSEIKRDYPHTQIIVLSNRSEPHFRTLCHQLGADYFFDKSTEFEKIPELLVSLRSVKM